MDTRTGKIHEQKPGESLEDMAKRLNMEPGDLVPLHQLPEPKCRKCGGTGVKRAGMFSRRFKPCRCTKAGWQNWRE